MTVTRLTCLLLALSTTAFGQANLDQTDNQFWSDFQVAVPVTKQVDFNLLGTWRLGRDFSHSVDERVGAGFSFKFGPHVTVSPNYLHLGMQPFAGRRIWENRLSLPVLLHFKIDKFTLRDRNQVERRYRNSGIKSTRYRNRLQLEYPIGSDKLGLSLFVTDEVFYDWTVDRWVRNRFGAGAIKVFNRHFSQDFYYMRQSDGVSVPGDLNIVGTTLRFRL
jgi:hypothetical protein